MSLPQLSTQQKPPTAMASLLMDVIRACAAALVVCDHWRNAFFVDYAQATDHLGPLSVLYLLTSAGHLAVVIFFVLSGYLISGSIFRSLNRGSWSWRSYLLHRVVRLWIVLLPGLLLCALWDGIGLRLRGAYAVSIYRGDSGNHLLGFDAHLSHTFAAFIGNLFFLQSILVPTFGSNGALWSLANEFFYYMLFPLALLALRPQTNWRARLGYLVLFSAVAALAGHYILLLFPAWLLGTLLASMPPLKVGRAIRWGSAAVYLPLGLALTKYRGLPGIVTDYLFAIATFLFLLVLLGAQGEAADRNLTTRFWRTFARFSYTLYVVHLPFLILISALLLHASRWRPDAAHLLAAAGPLVLALGLAFVVGSFTEFRTDKVRRWIELRVPALRPAQRPVSRIS